MKNPETCKSKNHHIFPIVVFGKKGSGTKMNGTIRNYNSGGTTDSPDTDIEILKLLYTEWENRQGRLWNLIAKSAIAIFILLLFPAIADQFNFDISLLTVPLWIFPICGLLVSILSLIIGQKEMLRLVQIKDCIRENANLLSNYKFKKAYSNTNGFNKLIVPVLFCTQILAAVVMLISLI